MADDSLKKLLVRLGLSTQDWQKSVQQIKNELKALQAQSLKDFKERQSNQKIELDSTKQQVAEQQALRAESQAMAAFDSAHAAWLRDQTEAIRQKTAQAILETAELRKQAVEQTALRRTEEEQIRLQQKQLQLEERRTKELEHQRIEAAKVPTAEGVQTLRAGVAGAVHSDAIQNIQTEALQRQIAEERALLAIKEAQLRVMSEQEGVRKVDVEVIQKEIAAERSKVSLLEAQLRARELQLRELKLEREATGRVSSAAGVQALRAGIAGATQADVVSSLQNEVLVKTIAEERAKLSVQEAQLRIMSQQKDVRQVDVEVVQKEISTERTKISLLESQLRLKLQQESSAEQERLRLARVPSVAGVATLRTKVTGVAATQAPLTQEQLASEERLLADEKAQLAVREAQLRAMSTQGDVRKADVGVLQGELTQERAHLAVKESQLRVQREQTQELEKQKRDAERVPSVSGVTALRTSVTEASRTDVVQKLQTEVLQQMISEERSKLSVQESQLRVLSQQEGVRKVDVEVVQREITAERSKISLLESQLRMRQQQTREIEKERIAQEKVPSEAGVAALRTGVTTAIPQTRISRQQIVDAEKLLAEERARISVQEAQLRVMSQQEGVRKADVTVLQKELEQERARLGVQEAQLSLQRAQAGGGGERGGGFIGGALLSVGGGMFGMGLPAMMAAGVAAGQLLERALEKVGERIREVGKAMLEAAGPAGSLREQFEKLARREGQDPEEFVNKLRVSTRGLVNDEKLFQVANQFMTGSLKISSEQIVHLTGLTVALARATARGPESVEQAMTALQRAALTGNVRMLTMVTGIDKAQISAAGLGRGISKVAQEQLQLSMITDAMARRFAEVGTPMTTVKDLFDQVDNVQKSFVNDMAYSITHSKSFAEAIQQVSAWLMKITPQLLDFAERIGSNLGGAFTKVHPLFQAFYGLAVSTETALVKLVTALDKAGTSLLNFGGKSGDTAKKFSLFGFYLHGMTTIMESVSLSVDLASLSLSHFYDSLQHPVGGESWDAFIEKVKKRTLEFQKAVQTSAAVEFAPPQLDDKTTPDEAGEHKNKTGLDPQIEAQRRRLRSQIAQEDAKTRLEIIKQGITDEEEAEKQKYEAGLESLTQFTLAEMALRDRAHKARLDEIEQEKQAKLTQLAEEARGQKDPTTGKYVGGMDPGVEALRKEQIEKQANLQVEQEDSRHQKETDGKYQVWYNDQLAAERTYVNKVNAIQKQGVVERTKILEEEFKLGGVGTDDYIAQRKSLIVEEETLTKQAADLSYAAGKKNAEDLAKLRLAYTEAEIQKEKDLQNLELQEASIRLAGARARYDQAREILQSGIDLAREAAGGLITPEQTHLMSQMRDMTREYIEQLREVQARTQPLSKDWADVSREMSRAVQEETKLNVELAKAKDYAGPLGQLFGTVASELRDLLGQKTASFLDTIARSLESISKVSTGVAAQMGGAGAMYKGLWSSFKGLFGGPPQKSQTAEDARQVFDRGLRSSAGQMDRFSSVVDTAISSLVNFANAAGAAATKLAQTETPTSPGVPMANLPGPYRSPTVEPSVLSLLGIDVASIISGPPVATPPTTSATPTVFGPPPPPVSPEPSVVSVGGGQDFGEFPFFKLGGVVLETGPAIVHAGEYVIPSDVFSQFIQTLNSFGNRIGGVLSRLGGGTSSESETTTASTVSSKRESKEDRERSSSERFVSSDREKGGRFDRQSSVFDRERSATSFGRFDSSRDSRVVERDRTTVLGGERRTSAETDRRLTLVRENISRSLEVKFPQLHRVEIERLTEQTIEKLREKHMFGPQPERAGEPRPHFQLGGVVPETGTAMVHAGEYVIPSEVFSQFIQALNGFAGKLGREGGFAGGGTVRSSGPLAAMFGLDKKEEKSGGPRTDPWKGVSDKVTGLVRALSDAVVALGKFTAQLTQASSLSKPSAEAPTVTPIQNALGQQTGQTIAPGSTVSQFFSQENAQSAFSNVQTLRAQAETGPVQTITSDLPDKLSSDGSPDSSGKGGLKGAADGLAGIFKRLTDSGSDFHEKLTGFTKNLGGAIGQIGGLLKGITGGKTAGQGALSGGMSGLSFGAQFGPIGMIAGAAGGALLGALMGHKQEEMQKKIDKLKDELQSIVDELNDGTVTMSTTLGQLRTERQQAVDLLSHGGGGKKGQKKGTTQQIQAVISQIDQEIQKVIDLQKQALDNMHQQIAELAQTPAYQPIVQQLDEIINKYKEFAAAAAGNAAAVASANEYLTESLKNYATTMSDQLHQANVQAVQDAIQLIDLQRQKNQLNAQAAEQEYGILTQGVTARQETTAMTKGMEIAQVKYQHDQQMQDMDEEIAVAQHKVDAEKKIFDLASTRIGLETQLLALQNETTDKQMLQIEALQQTIAAITSAIAGGNLPSALMAGGTLSTGSQLLSQILQLLGLSGEPGMPGSTVGGSTEDQYIAQWFPSEFYALLQNAVGAFPGYLQQIVPALETPPGSTQRQAQVSWYEENLKATASAENLPAGDWINFLNNGQFSGTPPTPPSYEVGGVVPETGPAIVHAGEYIIPSDIFSQFIQTLNSFGSRLANFMSGGGGDRGPAIPFALPFSATFGDGGSQLLDAHQQIFSLSTQRVAIESNLISLQQATIQMDLQRIQAWKDFLASSTAGGGVMSLEGAFAQVYEQRGRMGLGGFTRQVL